MTCVQDGGIVSLHLLTRSLCEKLRANAKNLKMPRKKKQNQQCVRRIPIRDAHDGLPHATLTNQSTPYTIYR